VARVSGVRSTFIDYVFVVLLTATIVVSIKIIGALLIEAMVVVPAAAARNLSRTTRAYLVQSIATALVAGVGGLFLSTQFLVPTGGAVVLVMSGLFFATWAAGWLRASDAGRAGTA
jgi:zinc transport system permease protein